jgi:hypothetical protein
MPSRKNTVPVSEWVDRISALITKTRETVFEIGEALAQAKEQLTQKNYKELLARLPMSKSTADNYIRAASSSILRDPNITKHLPNGVGALIDVAAWKDDDIKNAIDEGVMKPDAERGTLSKWINRQYKDDYKRRPKEFHDKIVPAWEVCVDWEKWTFGPLDEVDPDDPRSRDDLVRLKQILQKTAEEQFDQLVVIRSATASSGTFSRRIESDAHVDITGSVFHESCNHIANKLKPHTKHIEPLWGSPIILKFIKDVLPETKKVVPGLEKYGVINVDPVIDADNFSPEILLTIGRILTSADYNCCRFKLSRKYDFNISIYQRSFSEPLF